MGDYVSSRLFCISKKISPGSLPDGFADMISVSGMRAYKGGLSGVTA